MKKVLILLLLTVLAVPVLFAEVTAGGWGRIILDVSGTDVEDSEPVMNMGPDWAGDGGRVRFAIKGSSEKIGFNFEVDGNITTGFYGSNFSVGELINIWVRPIEMVKITAGKMQIDSLRGKFGGKSAAADQLWIGGGDYEDRIFARNRLSHGAAAEITPVEGLTINAGIQYDTADADGNVGTIEGTLGTVQLAVGYNIEGIGLARAQYVGYNSDGTIGSEDIQAAFALMAVEGLLVDIGVTIDIAADADPVDDPMVALGASYKIMDNVTAILLAQATFGDAMPMFLGLQAIYDMDSVSIRGEFAFHIEEDLNALMIYPYARMSFGNGYTSAGVKIHMNMATDAEVMTWAIPIVLEYWF